MAKRSGPSDIGGFISIKPDKEKRIRSESTHRDKEKTRVKKPLQESKSSSNRDDTVTRKNKTRDTSTNRNSSVSQGSTSSFRKLTQEEVTAHNAVSQRSSSTSKKSSTKDKAVKKSSSTVLLGVASTPRKSKNDESSSNSSSVAAPKASTPKKSKKEVTTSIVSHESRKTSSGIGKPSKSRYQEVSSETPKTKQAETPRKGNAPHTSREAPGPKGPKKSLKETNRSLKPKAEKSRVISERKDTKTKEAAKAEVSTPTRQGTYVKSEELSEERRSTSVEQDDEDNYEYEDDFEDYESDFEEDLSESSEGASEKNTNSASYNQTHISVQKKGEETKHDSGNYELKYKPDPGRLKLGPSVVKSIRQFITVENKKASHKERAESETDECKHVFDFKKSAVNSELTSRRKAQKARVTKLLAMIHLETSHIPLFDMEPVSYEVFMRAFGGGNAIQAGTQTVNDNPVEEIQTDPITVRDKWTQHPPKYDFLPSKSFLENLWAYNDEKEGSGADTRRRTADWFKKPRYSRQSNLSSFILSMGKVMLNILDESSYIISNTVGKTQGAFGFSNEYFKLNIDFIGQKRPVNMTLLSPHHPYHLLTVHNAAEEVGLKKESKRTSMACLWHVLEPSKPMKVFSIPSSITAICFDTFYSQLVHAGLRDGSVCVWDIAESEDIHERSKENSSELTLRGPSCLSSSLVEEEYHSGSISTVITTAMTDDYDDKKLSQLISIDDEGKIICWTVILPIKTSKAPYNMSASDLCVMAYAKVRLVFSKVLNPKDVFPKSMPVDNLRITCSNTLVAGKDRYLLFGTNLGSVLTPKLFIFQKRPVFYQNSNDCITEVTCLEPSRKTPGLFLVGCDNGVIRLHEVTKTRPLLVVNGSGSGHPHSILNISWSSERPGLFFVADKASFLHVWDLCKADLCPQFSVPFEKEIISGLALSSSRGPSYLIVGVGDSVRSFLLRDEFTERNSENEKLDVQKFECYLTLL